MSLMSVDERCRGCATTHHCRRESVWLGTGRRRRCAIRHPSRVSDYWTVCPAFLSIITNAKMKEVDMAKIHATSKLGDYIVAFKIATRSRVDEIRKTLAPTQMLGQALVQAGVCDSQTCEKIAYVQRLVRNNGKVLA